MAKHYDVVKEALLKQPGITGVTASSQSIMTIGSGTADVDWDGKRADQKSFLIQQESVDRNLLAVLHLQLAQGNGFTGTPADSSNFLLNETAVEQMGIKNPVGKRLTFHNQKGVIAGVVKDFHFDNLHNKIAPLIIYYGPDDNRILYVKTTAQNASSAVKALENMWQQYSAAYPFKYVFLDDKFNDMYKADQQVGKLFNCFAVITIFISCLGLLGLVTYTAESKVKEIGIRKAIGAGTYDIVSMLSKDFVRLVIISAVIACPVAYLAMSKWLENYQYRTAISAWVFLLAALGAVVIALATVGYQSYKAASANPVKALKAE
jgi:ABC-type antimicrobial peptide transport system permease subunit